MFRTLLAAGLILAGQIIVEAQEDVVVSGAVVDAAGKPAAGIEVAVSWHSSREEMVAHGESLKTDAAGRYTLSIPGWMMEAAVLALDSERANGGVVVIKPKGLAKIPTIRLAPAVKVFGHFESKELGRPLSWTNVYVSAGERARLVQSTSDKAEFGFVLPSGKYQFYGYGRDVQGVRREIEVPTGVKELDLGAIDLAATEIAKHIGKAPPPWFIKEARGLKKDVTIADFKGKWVLVDFWGYWCGPCVRKLSELIEFYESHAEHRDQFEIIAFHDASVQTLDEMDSRLDETKRTLWDDRDLPFPILLDDARKTATAYSIQSWPTTVLIDPEGKLVGEAGYTQLEEKLPKLPSAVVVARALNMKFGLGVEGESLRQLAEFFGRFAHVPIRFDEPALKAKQIDLDKPLPLTLSAEISLRSWLNLALAADELTHRPDDDGLLITVGRRNEDSPSQQKAAVRLRAILDEPGEFDFNNKTLGQVVQSLEEKTGVTFLLDPAGRRAGKIDPNAKVTAARGRPRSESPKALLKRLNLVPVVRDEVIVIEAP